MSAPQYPGQPGPPPGPVPPGYGGPTGFGGWAAPGPEHPNGTTILVLGILGFAVCQVLSPIAWVMGHRARKEIRASGIRYSNESQINAGWIMGIIGTVLITLALIIVAFALIVVLAASDA